MCKLTLSVVFIEMILGALPASLNAQLPGTITGTGITGFKRIFGA